MLRHNTVYYGADQAPLRVARVRTTSPMRNLAMLFRAPRLCGAVLLWLACAINPFLTCGTSLAFRVTAALYNGFVAWGMLVGPHVLAQTGIMWALSKVKPQYRTSTRVLVC